MVAVRGTMSLQVGSPGTRGGANGQPRAPGAEDQGGVRQGSRRWGGTLGQKLPKQTPVVRHSLWKNPGSRFPFH